MIDLIEFIKKELRDVAWGSWFIICNSRHKFFSDKIEYRIVYSYGVKSVFLKEGHAGIRNVLYDPYGELERVK